MPAPKGHLLEEVLREYFSQAGYFAVRGIPIRIEGDDVTDIDLWLYERPAAASRRRLIVDAKNKKAPKAAERIIWAKGLQLALNVDAAIIATTDRRPGIRRFAKQLGISVLGGEAVAKLMASKQLNQTERLSNEDFEALVKAVDKARRGSEWNNWITASKSSLSSNFGVVSMNISLQSALSFAEQAVISPPQSKEAEIAIRGFYLTSAFAAISLDFVAADLAFASPEERRETLVAGLRYGSSNSNPTTRTVSAALALIRQYADNGGPVAAQVRQRFETEAGEIKAEIIADFASKTPQRESLFGVARELEQRAFSSIAFGFDQLTDNVKGYAGALLDFGSVPRDRFATAFVAPNSELEPLGSLAASGSTSTLFDPLYDKN